MHVGVETGVPAEEIPDLLVGCVENMGAVLVDHYPVAVPVIIAVPRDMVGGVYHRDLVVLRHHGGHRRS